MAIPLLLAAAGLSAAGGLASSWLNQKSANKQMAFQERMSSTAAQRSAADFRAAGLNPALAYGHTASSPSGASVTTPDPITPAIASARDASVAKQQMELAKQEQANRNLETKSRVGLNNALFDKATQEASVAEQNKMSMIRENHIGSMLLPQTMQARLNEALRASFITDHAKSAAQLEALKIPGARNAANLQNFLGVWGSALPMAQGSASSIANILRAVRFR